ncbi:MAG: ABC transporter permease [Gaiellaceae bacterium]
MTVLWAQARAATVELVRYPSFSIPTLALPAIVFVIFGASQNAETARLAMASYAAFAFLGVAFFQFGVGIATEQTSPWHTYLRILAAGPGSRFGARILSALAFGLASGAVVIVAALVTTDVSLPAGRWALLLATLVVGTIPFALLGIAIGYWFSPRGALPVANLLYLALSFLGGLWTASRHATGLAGAVAPYTPTRGWLDLLAAAVGTAPWRPHDIVLLGAWAVAAAALATAGYRRDEGERYR